MMVTKSAIEARIEALLNEKFANSDCFLVNVDATNPQNIEVAIESDELLTVDVCAEVSRFLEKYLEEEQLVPANYNLEVSSPGLTTPFKVFRQYPKNIGRTILVKQKNGVDVEGVLLAATPEAITVEQHIHSKNPKNKKKEIQTVIIPLEQIISTQKTITF
jgi:ribosome maturation factor RimP